MCVEIQEDKEKPTESGGARARQEGEGVFTDGLKLITVGLLY